MDPADSDVIVVGGGAAGFFAAITCAEAAPGRRIRLLEATAHPLAKVRVSGGGRCNVTHACFDPKELASRYPRGGRELLGAFHRWQPRDTVGWFAGHGVELKTEADGRMFPVTDRSESVVECLQEAARRGGVEIRTRSPVKSAAASVGGFEVTLGTGETVRCQRLLLATGGGRSSAGFEIARFFGHTIEPLVPSLFTLHIADPRIAGLAGVSVPQARAALEKDFAAEGPALITHWGLSGPAILKLSAWAARELAACNYVFPLRLSWIGTVKPAQAREVLGAARTGAHARQKLSTWNPWSLPGRLWERLVGAAGAGTETTWSSASNTLLDRLTSEAADATYAVAGKSLNKEEFVTCGGVRLAEVDFRTMESKRQPGLHFAGEVLDLDGVTGGFNFQAAWTTGRLAGLAMA